MSEKEKMSQNGTEETGKETKPAKATEKDAHSNVKNKRVCKEGPVFRAEEVDF